MNVAPINGEYFHVSHQKNYNHFPALAIGDTITVGKEVNPFFTHYERTRQYKVTTPDGPTMVPALRFFNEVRKGNIGCNDLPVQAYNVVNHYNTLARELILEEVRRDVAPYAPSRKTCLWVSDTMELAQIWHRKLAKGSHMFRLELDGQFHAGDARLMMNDSEPLSDAYTKAKRYWQNDTSENPLPEILFEGKATVLEILTEP